MAVWSAGAQRPCKGVRQQEGGGKGGAPQRGRGEGSQAAIPSRAVGLDVSGAQGVERCNASSEVPHRSPPDRLRIRPGRTGAAAPLIVARKNTLPDRGQGKGFPPAPRGSSADACGCGRSPRCKALGGLWGPVPPRDRAGSVACSPPPVECRKHSLPLAHVSANFVSLPRRPPGAPPRPALAGVSRPVAVGRCGLLLGALRLGVDDVLQQRQG